MNKQIQSPELIRKKKGFTLIEAVLVIAITVIIVPMILATFIIIRDSHENVAFLNDAKSFAYLNQRAIDNLIVNAEAAKTSNSTSPADGMTNVIHVSDGHRLMVNGTQVFDYNHYTTSSGQPRWTLEIEFTAVPNQRNVSYVIRIFDSETGDLFYTLRTSSFLPNATTSDISSDGSSTLMFRPLTPP